MHDLDRQMRQRVSDAPVARLATVRPDGHPHVVPITYAVDGETIVTAVDHKPKTTSRLQRIKNIEAHPQVSLVIDNYDDDWSRLWWVRADGTASIVNDGAGRERAVQRLVDKYYGYRGHPPRGPLIVVAVQRWTSWSSDTRAG